MLQQTWSQMTGRQVSLEDMQHLYPNLNGFLLGSDEALIRALTPLGSAWVQCCIAVPACCHRPALMHAATPS